MRRVVPFRVEVMLGLRFGQGNRDAQMRTNDPSVGVAEVLQLEHMKFMEWVHQAADEQRAEMAALERSLAAKGLAFSGTRHIGDLEIIVKARKGLGFRTSIMEALRCWSESA